MSVNLQRATTPATRRSPLARAHTWAAVAFLLIPVAGLILFRFWPIVQALYNSVHDYNLISGQRIFTGLANYGRAFSDPDFLKALGITLLFVAGKLIVQIPLALGLALLVERPWRGVGLVRTAMYLPVVTSYVVVSTLWTLMYNPSHGIINAVLRSGGFGPIEFLTNPNWALPAVVLMTIWKDVGFTSIIFLAGLQGISMEYYEAAAVDGATAVQRFRFITLPLLRRISLFVMITSTISAFQVYTPIYIMTQGGPMGLTRVITFYIYQRGFLFFEMGYASALAIILLGIILAVSSVYMKVLRAQH